MKIWITGAEGMLGSILIDYCKNRGIEVLGTSRSQADITHLDSLGMSAQAIRPTHIINCAAYTNVDGAEKDQKIAFAVNAEGAENMALTARECGARLIHLSTDYVFSGTGSQPYKEDDVCCPMNVYGQSKREGEVRIMKILPSACILRTSWLFGAKGKNFISSLLTSFQQKEELQVVADQCGRPTYICDLAEAVFLLLNQEGIFHFANTGALSRYQIAMDMLEVVKQLGYPHICQRIVPVLSAQFLTIAPRPSYSVLDTQKYFHHTNRQPRSWSTVVREFLTHEL